MSKMVPPVYLSSHRARSTPVYYTPLPLLLASRHGKFYPQPFPTFVKAPPFHTVGRSKPPAVMPLLFTVCFPPDFTVSLHKYHFGFYGRFAKIRVFFLFCVKNKPCAYNNPVPIEPLPPFFYSSIFSWFSDFGPCLLHPRAKTAPFGLKAA